MAFEKTYKLTNDMSELERLPLILSECAQNCDFDDEVSFKINLALDELLTNTISYGFPDGGESKIILNCELSDELAAFEIIDDGVEFNPLKAKKPDLDAPAVEREIGGLGVHIVKNVMNKFEYKRENGKNIVTIAINLK